MVLPIIAAVPVIAVAAVKVVAAAVVTTAKVVAKTAAVAAKATAKAAVTVGKTVGKAVAQGAKAVGRGAMRATKAVGRGMGRAGRSVLRRTEKSIENSVRKGIEKRMAGQEEEKKPSKIKEYTKGLARTLKNMSGREMEQATPPPPDPNFIHTHEIPPNTYGHSGGR